MINLTTNNNFNSLSLIISEQKIKITTLPTELRGKELMVLIKNSLDKDIIKLVYAPYDNIECDIKDLIDGVYSLSLLYLSADKGLYWSYFSKTGILFSIYNKMPSFDVPLISISNGIKYNKLINRFDVRFLTNSCDKFQSGHSDIINQAREITKHEYLNFSKVKAIHDWVAENIFYDMDSVRDGSYVHFDQSALNVLQTKKGVCQGYSNLCIALLRAINIPSIEIPCFALNMTSSGGWDKSDNLQAGANHVITAAFAQNKWILMDVTWDSDNIIEYGQSKCKTGFGVKHLYFDITIPFISNTHRITMI